MRSGHAVPILGGWIIGKGSKATNGENRSESIGRPDLLDRLQTLAPKLHAAEVRAALVILEDPEVAGRLSIQALAQKANVSEPTILRLVRKLGCAGFTDFKHQLNEHLVVTRMFLRTDVLIGHDPSSIIERMHEAATRTLTEMLQMLDRDAFERSVRSIASARRILALGVGGASANIAQEAENRFFRLGLAVNAVSDPYRQRMHAAILAPEDVVIAFSATGKPKSILDSVHIARRIGAHVIAVTPPGSAMAQAADTVLALNVFSDEVYFNLPSPTRYAQLYLLDCIAASVAIELGATAFNRLRAIRVTLSALHGAMKFQPMGD